MALAYQPNMHVTGLHLTPEGFDEEKMEDEHLFTQEIVEDALGCIPDWMDVKVKPASSIREGILQELRENQYDLMITGAGSEVFSYRYLFGAVNDRIIENINCSILIVRRYQAEAAIWLRRRIRQLEV